MQPRAAVQLPPDLARINNVYLRVPPVIPPAEAFAAHYTPERVFEVTYPKGDKRPPEIVALRFLPLQPDDFSDRRSFASPRWDGTDWAYIDQVAFGTPNKVTWRFDLSDSETKNWVMMGAQLLRFHIPDPAAMSVALRFEKLENGSYTITNVPDMTLRPLGDDELAERERRRGGKTGKVMA